MEDITAVVFRSVLGNDLNFLKELHEAGHSFDVVDETTGNTPLHVASSKGLLPVVQLICEISSRSLSAKNKTKKTPLHLAVERKFVEVGKYLVLAGADLELKDVDGKTPRDVADPWLRSELALVASERHRMEALGGALGAVNKYGEQSQRMNAKSGSGVALDTVTDTQGAHEHRGSGVSENALVWLKNMKTSAVVEYSAQETMRQVASRAAAALGFAGDPQVAQGLALYSRSASGDTTELPGRALLSRVRSNDWKDVDEYQLVLMPKRGSSSAVTGKYRTIMYK